MLSFFLKCYFCLLTFQKLTNAQLDGAGRESLSECPSYEIYDSCGRVDQSVDMELVYEEGPDSFEGRCNSTVISNERSGTIESPNYPMEYDPNSCYSWYITLPEGMAISIEFNSTFNLYTPWGGHCKSYDSLSFLGYRTYCGRSWPAMFHTTSNSLNVYFITDGSVQKEGFSFAWYAVDTWTQWSSYSECSVTCGDGQRTRRRRCGADDRSNPPPRSECVDPANADDVDTAACNLGQCEFCTTTVIHNKRSGTIVSPNYPMVYDSNACYSWYIAVPDGMVIAIVFNETFSIQDASTCRYDSLVFHGYETYCGHSPPATFTTTGSSLNIYFTTDGSVQRAGFSFTWYAVGLCNSTVISNKTSGTIESPNYPMEYNPDSCYSWYITLPDAMVISIEFNNTFDLETSWSGQSGHDSLTFHGYRNYSGYSRPVMFQTTSNSLDVYFITNGDVQKGGFSFTWYAVDTWTQWSSYSECSVTCGDGQRTRRRRCGPVDRSNPPPRSECSDPANAVDTVACSLVPCELCPTTVIHNKSSGTIESPNYPNPYHSNACYSWYITVPDRMVIAIVFNETFSIEYASSCRYDSLVFHGYKTYCGDSPPATFTTTGSSLNIYFTTDGIVQRAGFSFAWYASGLCDSTVISNKTSGTIESPNYPKEYDSNSCYSWYITLPEATVISIEFNNTFDLETSWSGNSGHDSLTFHGYRNYSGYSQPAMFQTTSNSLNVYFITNGDVQKGGFSFAWYAVDTWTQWSSYSECSVTCGDGRRTRRRRCGPDDRSNQPPRSECSDPSNAVDVDVETCNLRQCELCTTTVIHNKTSGTIESPNYPMVYDSYACYFWYITMPERMVIAIVFNETFSIQDARSCRYDSLRFYGYETYCGNSPPVTFTTTGSSLKIQFTTDGNVQNVGFSFAWYAVGLCNSTVISNKTFGTIESPNYPMEYDPNSCYLWHITLPEAMVVSTEFNNTFDLETSWTGQSGHETLTFHGYRNYSGYSRPAMFQTTSNSLNVYFITNGDVQKGGFSFTWYAVDTWTQWSSYSECSVTCGDGQRTRRRRCGPVDRSNPPPRSECADPTNAVDTVACNRVQCELCNTTVIRNERSGTIESPNYPMVYDSHACYSWYITVPDEMVIAIVFNEGFSIEYAGSCNDDSLRFDGYETYCGHSPPVPFTTTGSSLNIYFTTDDREQYAGFSFAWYAVDPVKESLSHCLRYDTHLIHESCYDDFLCVHQNGRAYGIGRKELAECMCRNNIRLETARCINLTIVNVNDNKTITTPEYWSVEPKKSADDQPAGGNNWGLGNDESTEWHETNGTSITKSIVSYILMLYMVAVLFCP